MQFYLGEVLRRQEILRWIGIAIVVVIVGGLLGYYGSRTWKENPEMIRQLGAKIVEFFKVKEETVEEVPEEIALKEGPEIIIPEEKTYIETAELGEGITHLARRALKEYLSEKPQDFEITPEHKIYIEDYLAKSMGDRWLNLGEKVEFSEVLLKEAIGKAKTLTPEQLQNLTQFSQLVPSI
jgi:hypothetical protein